jgi:hypothetical protein
MRARLASPARMVLGLALLATMLPDAAGAAPERADGRRLTLDVLDSVDLPAEAAGQRVRELSGLAWDKDENVLYAISDRGRVHHFTVRIDGGRIAALRRTFSAELASPAGARQRVNAEGLDVVNAANGRASDTELLVAIEDGPVLARYTPRGDYLGSLKLPDALLDAGSYQGKNERLESAAAHPRYGVLTAPEAPLRSRSDEVHTIFAMDGGEWSFATFQAKRSSLKAMEALPDGSLLILERTRDEKGGDPHARLRHVDLPNCADGTACSVTEVSPSGDVPPGNYEGLARISDDLFLMVSDQTGGDDVPARLVLFRLRASS